MDGETVTTLGRCATCRVSLDLPGIEHVRVRVDEDDGDMEELVCEDCFVMAPTGRYFICHDCYAAVDAKKGRCIRWKDLGESVCRRCFERRQEQRIEVAAAVERFGRRSYEAYAAGGST